MFPNNFGKQLVDALLHVLITIGRVFVLPLSLWIKSTSKLVAQKQEAALDMNKIDSPWPFFSWVKRWIIDFFFDALAFVSYPLGVIAAFITFFSELTFYNEFTDKREWYFGFAIGCFFGCIASAYFAPLFISYLHDCTVMLLLPIKKIIDWFKKPAQYLELKNKE